MPIRVPKALPAIDILKKENIFVMDDERAKKQDIRPLKIIILNLMPKKQETEVQLLRLLSNTPLQIDVDFLYMSSHEAKNTAQTHLERFYYTFSQVKNNFYDGLIVTGAPVEQLPFEEVDYWQEFTQILDWSKTHVFSNFYICWGAQASLYHQYGVKKKMLAEKLSGIYKHQVDNLHQFSILKGFDDVLNAPHSRYTEVSKDDILKINSLKIIIESDEAGIFLVANENNRDFYAMGHLEYDRNTLNDEFVRDTLKKINPNKPKNYYPNDNENKQPKLVWHMAASLLFSNWLNYSVYQNTPFDLKELLKNH